jgi:hypothetical protein
MNSQSVVTIHESVLEGEAAAHNDVHNALDSKHGRTDNNKEPNSANKMVLEAARNATRSRVKSGFKEEGGLNACIDTALAGHMSASMISPPSSNFPAQHAKEQGLRANLEDYEETLEFSSTKAKEQQAGIDSLHSCTETDEAKDAAAAGTSLREQVAQSNLGVASGAVAHGPVLSTHTCMGVDQHTVATQPHHFDTAAAAQEASRDDSMQRRDHAEESAIQLEPSTPATPHDMIDQPSECEESLVGGDKSAHCGPTAEGLSEAWTDRGRGVPRSCSAEAPGCSHIDRQHSRGSCDACPDVEQSLQRGLARHHASSRSEHVLAKSHERAHAGIEWKLLGIKSQYSKTMDADMEVQLRKNLFESADGVFRPTGSAPAGSTDVSHSNSKFASFRSETVGLSI